MMKERQRLVAAPLFAAVKSGSVSKLKSMIAAGARLTHYLNMIIRKRYCAAFRPKLISTFDSPDTRHVLGWTCLMVAAISGNVSCTRALLELGADPNLKDHFTDRDVCLTSLICGFMFIT